MPLQKQFRGLPAYLGEFEAGEQQFERSPVIQPAFDVNDFMAPPEDVLFTGPLAAGNGNNVPGPSVPDGEVWRVTWFAFNLATPAGWIGTVMALEFFKAEAGISYAVNTPVSVQGGQVASVGWHPGRRVLLRAGDNPQVTLQWQSVGAGNGALTAVLQVQKLKF